MDFIMKILCIGDIVSRIGRDMLFKYVDDMKYQKGIDLVIANGENATHGRGLARNAYDELIRAGIDVITMVITLGTPKKLLILCVTRET